MKLEGRVWKFGSDIDTDAIIPARYLNLVDADQLARHAMERSRRSSPRARSPTSAASSPPRRNKFVMANKYL